MKVNAFYMDKNKVTKALWDEIYTWAVAHGYGFNSAGAGKAANHPVHTINWHDCLKWCTAALLAENLALRQHLAVLRRSVRRPRLRNRDRVFWAWLSRLWKGWRSALTIVQPETVVKWRRAGFRLYWRWRSRTTVGRPRKSRLIRNLIREMSRHNPTWGASRIRAELLLLGHDVAESTVARYMIRPRKPPSPTWRSFLTNQASQIAAIDFFTVYSRSRCFTASSF